MLDSYVWVVALRIFRTFMSCHQSGIPFKRLLSVVRDSIDGPFAGSVLCPLKDKDKGLLFSVGIKRKLRIVYRLPLQHNILNFDFCLKSFRMQFDQFQKMQVAIFIFIIKKMTDCALELIVFVSICYNRDLFLLKFRLL